MIARIRANIEASIEAKQKILEDPGILEAIHAVARACIATYQNEGKILLAGNGGSAADAQHIAAEFVCRFDLERPALPAIAFNVNTSTMTAVANDYGYSDVFKRQVEALALPGDLFIGISTSGNSPNVLDAVKACRDKGLVTVGLTGQNGRQLEALCDHCVMVPSESTPRIQESHIMIGHIICGLVEQALFGRPK